MKGVATVNLEEVKQALKAPVVSIRKADDHALRVRTAAARAYVDLMEGAELRWLCGYYFELTDFVDGGCDMCRSGECPGRWVRLVPVSEETP